MDQLTPQPARRAANLNTFVISFEQLEEVISLIARIHSFDFDSYTRASLKRRVSRVMQLYNLSFFDLKTALINHAGFFDEFLNEVTVNVTEMFRDPHFFEVLRRKTLPYLSSFQRIKIWNAGCSSGEELYSFGIMLKEEGLYNRSFLYGTDINSRMIERAREGIYELRKMKQYSENYQAAGAPASLSDYYTARYDAVVMHRELQERTLFSVHNLVSDGVFNEFQLISCRNVLIYFNVELQQRVIRLFYESLCPFGFLCLGSKETLKHAGLASRFKVIDASENIYQKIA
jgi:chemotaxis protein methyltransferase CheR